MKLEYVLCIFIIFIVEEIIFAFYNLVIEKNNEPHFLYIISIILSIFYIVFILFTIITLFFTSNEEKIFYGV